MGPWGRSGPRSGGWPWPGEQPVDRCLMENRERIGQGDGRSVMLPAPVVAPATVVADRGRKISMMRIGPPQQGHGSRRVSGMISARRLRLLSGPVGAPSRPRILAMLALRLRAGEQAVVPDAVEAVGQHVDQEPADELVRWRAASPFAGRRT